MKSVEAWPFRRTKQKGPSMMPLLVAPVLLLVFTIFDGPVSRLLGFKFVATILFAGVVVAGLGWHAAIAGGCDIALLLGGGALARRVGLSPHLSPTWMRRIALAFSAFLILEFAALAMIATLLTGLSVAAIPFDFGFLLSGISFAILVSRRRNRGVPEPHGKSRVSIAASLINVCFGLGV